MTIFYWFKSIFFIIQFNYNNFYSKKMIITVTINKTIITVFVNIIIIIVVVVVVLPTIITITIIPISIIIFERFLITIVSIPYKSYWIQNFSNCSVFYKGSSD